MVMSMTGFGRESKDLPLGRFVIEMQSVNRKHFEVQMYLPKEFSRFEYDMRKWISEKILRGFITVRIQWIPSKKILPELLPDPLLIKDFKLEWEKIAKKAGFPKSSIDFHFLMQQMPLFGSSQEIQEELSQILKKGVENALISLIEMRQKEGLSLSKDIQDRLKKMKKVVKEIESLSEISRETNSERLKQKMKELTDSSDERLFREIVLWVEKLDISEELTRLESHFSQFQECLQFSQKGLGRKMDFLVQEMAREINTIGSKSMDTGISRLVIDFKSELEKVREQVQNIE